MLVAATAFAQARELSPDAITLKDATFDVLNEEGEGVPTRVCRILVNGKETCLHYDDRGCSSDNLLLAEAKTLKKTIFLSLDRASPTLCTLSAKGPSVSEKDREIAALRKQLRTAKSELADCQGQKAPIDAREMKALVPEDAAAAASKGTAGTPDLSKPKP